MSDVERTTSWQQIQSSVKGAERLIVRKEYNLVMAKVRQVLEYMVRRMAERACLVEGDLSDTTDQLYEGCWTNKTIKDNYHIIRILDNKVAHEGDDTAYDANRVYQLPTQEVYAPANEFFRGRSSVRMPQTERTTSPRQTSRHQGSSSRLSARSLQSGSRRPAQSGGQCQGGPRKKKHRRVSPVSYIWRLLIPVLIVVLLTAAIRTIVPPGDKDRGNLTTAPTVTTATTEPAPTLSSKPETVPETEPPVATYRVKGSSVNVCTEPSTDSCVIVQLTNGTEMDHVKRYNNDWDVINYDGQKAYISSWFLEKMEPVTETEAPATSGNGQNN